MSDHEQSDFLFALTRAYHLLGALSDRLHAGHGVTTGIRSILLLLHSRGAMTLSEIARDRGVSRQFIQRIAAPLLGDGRIVQQPNAANRRSPKLSLSPQGEAMVAGIIAREAGIRAAIAQQVGSEDAAALKQAIDRLNEALAGLSDR